MFSRQQLLEELNAALRLHPGYVEGMAFTDVERLRHGYRHTTRCPPDGGAHEFEAVFDEVARQVYERLR